MTPKYLVALIGFLALPSFAAAEEWVSLGGSPAGEIDISSIARARGLVRATVRIHTPHPQGRLSMYQVMDMNCAESLVRISDGWIESSFSSHVSPMPDLPEDDRNFTVPVTNEAYNNMVAYACAVK